MINIANSIKNADLHEKILNYWTGGAGFVLRVKTLYLV